MRTYSSFLRRKVKTESGRKLGSCHDLRAKQSGSKLHVTALVVGRGGLLEHFGVRSASRRHTVPWAAVVRIEGDRIVVRDGTETE